MCRFLTLALMLATFPTYALEIGDKAPALEIEKWLNGDPVNPSEPDGKTIYVVEFWATWCPPCRTSVPHLNELHNDLKDKNVIIAGVTDEGEGKVMAFTEGVPIDYRIALDTKGTASEAYMRDIGGIPHVFVVDTNGIVVWSGHPMAGLKEDLDLIIAGTFDPTARQKQQDAEAELAALFEEDPKTALKKLEKLIKAYPSNFTYYQAKAGLMAHLGQIDELKALYENMLGPFAQEAETLNTIAWMIVTSPLQMRNLEAAAKAAQMANTLTEESNPAVLDTLARVYYSLGLIDFAVETQRKAVNLEEDMENKQDLSSILDYYRVVEAVRSSLLKRSGAPEN